VVKNVQITSLVSQIPKRIVKINNRKNITEEEVKYSKDEESKPLKIPLNIKNSTKQTPTPSLPPIKKPYSSPIPRIIIALQTLITPH
jgi:hypothetical protein